MAVPLRAEVPVEETWELADLYADEPGFEEALAIAEQHRLQFLTRLELNVDQAGDLLALIRHLDPFIAEAFNIVGYAFCKFAEDGANPENQARMGRAAMFQNVLAAAKTAFAEKIISIPAATLDAWLESDEELQAYAPIIKEITSENEHRLSNEIESALAQFSSFMQAPSGIYDATLSADMSFKPVMDSEGNEVSVTPFYIMTAVETSTDTVLRQKSYRSLTEGLKPYQNSLSAVLGAHIQRQVTESRLRRYPTVLHMLQQEKKLSAVLPFLSNGVDPEHFFMVQDLMFQELAPHMRRYMKLRSRVLGLATPLLSDVKAPLESLHNEIVTFERAKEIILNAAKPLGNDYERILKRAFDERWIYRARNAGNWNGAFCWFPDRHPYVFAPFEGRLFDTFILGHELGHAVHIELFTKNQLPSNRAVSPLFVETPSTLMEHMIARYLRENSSDQGARRTVNMLQLLTFHHNFVTHQTEAEILRRLYQTADEGKPLSVGIFRKISRDVLQDFWKDSINLDDGCDLYWMRQPHYYMGLASYVYSVGLVASTVLASRIVDEGDGLVSKWITVLKSGGSLPPLQLFKLVDIDMSSPEPYRQAIQYVGQLIDDLERSYLQ